MKSPNPSASPFTVANPAQAARPGRNTACIPPGHVGSFTEFATGKGGAEEFGDFMNNPG